LPETFGAKRFESTHLSFDIISLNIEMNVTRMINLLHLNVQVPGVSLQPNVVDVFRFFLCAARQTKGVAPEIGRSLKVGCLTIDYESRQPAAMHCLLLPHIGSV
jgi:hypothetical protein